MTSDLDLLGRFARENSQDAFAEIVRRHLNLVYSAALRQVRSPQQAEDISQSVFADLARDAGKLNNATGGTPVLTAWLYAVTRRTAIDEIRKESRRQLREQIAVEMTNMNATSSNWTQIAPLLDDAMAALDETDRSAILLRYFENKNLREVGETLGASEDAAQKRVSRAVERLREFFSKRNVTIGAGGLTVLISANAVQSAPVEMAATISAAAVLAGTAVSTSTTIVATKAIAMTTLQKTIIGTAFIAAVGTGVFEARQASHLRDQVQTLQQQQAPLAEQIRQLQRERDDATNRLAWLTEEIAKNKENNLELLKLRGEVGVLRYQPHETITQTIATAISPQSQAINIRYTADHPQIFWITNNTEKHLNVTLSKIQVQVGSQWQDTEKLRDPTLLFYPTPTNYTLMEGNQLDERKQWLGPHESGFGRLYAPITPIPKDKVWRAEFCISEALTGQEHLDAVANEEKFIAQVEAKGFTNLFTIKPADMLFYSRPQLIYSEAVPP